MRKCVDLLLGGCVFTGQERPQGMGKKVRLHLYKKFATGEGIRGRLPYAIVTRMIRLFGWKRLEVNSLFDLEEVTEKDFESIFRRSSVIKIFSRLFDKVYLAANDLLNAEQYGIFARRCDLPSSG